MKTQIIQLEAHDDLITARDKMGWSKAPRILLVWPRKGRILSRDMDLLVLQRHARGLGAMLGLVTSNEEIRANARSLGIPCFHSAVEAQKQPWRRARSEHPRYNWVRVREGRPKGNLRDRRPQPEKENVPLGWGRVFVFLAGVLAVLGLMWIFVPSAVIQVQPALGTQTQELDVWADPALNAALPSGGVPAQVVSTVVEGALEARSGGNVPVADRSASGQVEFTNLTDQAVALPAGTVVTTSSQPPVRYMTLQPVRIDAGNGKTGRASVQAVLAGSAGNQPAGALRSVEGALGLLVLANNPSAIAGGSDRISPAPSEKDYNALRDRLLSELRATALQEIGSQAGQGVRILESTLQSVKVIEETRTPEENQPGDFARLTLRVEFSGWVIRESDLQQVANTALNASLPSGSVSLTSSAEVAFLTDPAQDDAGLVRWRIRAERPVEAAWSPDSLARYAAGKSPAQAAAGITAMMDLPTPARVRVSPSWWPRLPFLSFRIQVERN